MTRLNWDLTWHEAKWFRKTKILKFGLLLKLPKNFEIAQNQFCASWGLLLNQRGSNLTCMDLKGHRVKRVALKPKNLNHENCLIQKIGLNRTEWIDSDCIGPNRLNRIKSIETDGFESDRTDWIGPNGLRFELKSEIANAWRLTLTIARFGTRTLFLKQRGWQNSFWTIDRAWICAQNFGALRSWRSLDAWRAWVPT